MVVVCPFEKASDFNANDPKQINTNLASKSIKLNVKSNGLSNLYENRFNGYAQRTILVVDTKHQNVKRGTPADCE